MLPITKFLLFIMAYYIILFITTLLSAVSGVGEGGGVTWTFFEVSFLNELVIQ